MGALRLFALLFSSASCGSELGERADAGAVEDGGEESLKGTLLFASVRLFDGERVRDRVDVLVDGDRIVAVGDALRVDTESLEVVDGAGLTLMPGLIDAHQHLVAVTQPADWLSRGISTALDMACDWQLAAAVRAELAEPDRAPMADVFVAGNPVTPPGGYGTDRGLTLDTLDVGEDADVFVAARAEEGSDYVKIMLDDGHLYGADYALLDQTSLEGAIESAHERSLLTLAHVITQAEARRALEAGIDGLAHVFADSPPEADFATLAAEAGIFVVPTLHTGRSAPPVYYGYAVAAVASLYAAGVPLLAGSDDPEDAGGLHDDIVLLVDAGLDPIDALRGATALTADAFGLGDRGRVAEGLLADLVLLDGDPTTDIGAVQRIAGVWKRGEAVTLR